jgi:hypothetical protein
MNLITIPDRRFGVANRRALPVIPSDVLWDCDFTQPLGNYGWAEQSKVPGRATLVTANGRTCVRLHTEPGDNGVNNSLTWERNDLEGTVPALIFNEGQEMWFAHSVLFPNDYVDPPESQLNGVWNAGVVFDFHNSLPGGGQANFMMLGMPVTAITPDRSTGISYQMSWGTQAASQAQNYPIGPVQRNVWYDSVYHALWTAGAGGYFDAWTNGVHKMHYIGPTLYFGQGVYTKLANYHTAFGLPTSVLHSRIVVGKTAASVALTPLGA